MFKLKLVGLALVMLLTGCASFRDGSSTPMGKWPPANPSREKSIVVRLSGKGILNGKSAEANAAMLKRWREVAIDSYKESALFSAVKSGTESGDIYADIEVLDEGKGSQALAFLSGLSLMTIPATGSDTLTIRTTYKDGNGTVLGTYSKTEKVDFWIHLFLLPAMPFKFPGTVSDHVMRDMHHGAMLDAHAKSVF